MGIGIKVGYKNGDIDRDGRTYAYGMWIHPWLPYPGKDIKMPRPMWDIEREIYWRLTNGFPVPPGTADRKHHFIEYVNLIWGVEDSIYPFEWNPIAEKMLDRKLEHKFLMIGGHGGCGKSRFAGVWGISNFLFDPYNTKALVTSITRQAAKGKIWGDITEAWQQACKQIGKSYGAKTLDQSEKFLPGKFTQEGIIRYSYGGIDTEKAGLELVPGGVDKAKESAEKIQGYHRGRVFAILDELSTLDHGLMRTVESNIYTNSGADIIGLFNPDSHHDPAGKASEPIKGWGSVSVDDEEWPNKMGWTLRIDGAKSPNVVLGYERYKGLLSHREYEEQKIALGEHSKEFMKMYRAWWSTAGVKDAIYTELEIEESGAAKPITNEWISSPTKVAFMDPAFAHNGDKAMMVIGECGDAMIEGKIRRVLNISQLIRLDTEVDSRADKPAQIANLFIHYCKKNQVAPINAGLDATGSQLYSLIAQNWSPEVLQVGFGEVASDAPISAVDPTPCKNRYSRKVDEIWHQPKGLIRCHQLKGIPSECIAEMTTRQKDIIAGKIKVESKEKMKERALKSPDSSDALFGLAFLCSQRLKLTPIEFTSMTGRSFNPAGAVDIMSLLSNEKPSQQLDDVYDFSMQFGMKSPAWD